MRTIEITQAQCGHTNENKNKVLRAYTKERTSLLTVVLVYSATGFMLTGNLQATDFLTTVLENYTSNTNIFIFSSNLSDVGSENHPIKKVAITIDTSCSHTYTSCSCKETVPTNMKFAVWVGTFYCMSMTYKYVNMTCQ